MMNGFKSLKKITTIILLISTLPFLLSCNSTESSIYLERSKENFNYYYKSLPSNYKSSELYLEQSVIDNVTGNIDELLNQWFVPLATENGNYRFGFYRPTIEISNFNSFSDPQSLTAIILEGFNRYCISKKRKVFIPQYKREFYCLEENTNEMEKLILFFSIEEKYLFFQYVPLENIKLQKEPLRSSLLGSKIYTAEGVFTLNAMTNDGKNVQIRANYRDNFFQDYVQLAKLPESLIALKFYEGKGFNGNRLVLGIFDDGTVKEFSVMGHESKTMISERRYQTNRLKTEEVVLELSDNNGRNFEMTLNYKNINRLVFKNSNFSDKEVDEKFENKISELLPVIAGWQKQKELSRKESMAEFAIHKKQQEKKEVEQAKAAKEKALADAALSSKAKLEVARLNMIGKQICKDGLLAYYAEVYYPVFDRRTKETVSEPGQIKAVLESYSEDKSRIQFRVSGYATKKSILKAEPLGDVKIDNMILEQGLIHWDDIDKWYPCR